MQCAETFQVRSMTSCCGAGAGGFGTGPAAALGCESLLNSPASLRCRKVAAEGVAVMPRSSVAEEDGKASRSKDETGGTMSVAESGAGASA